MWQRTLLRKRLSDTAAPATAADAEADAIFEERANLRRRVGSLMLLPSGPGRWMWDVALAVTLLVLTALAVLPYDASRAAANHLQVVVDKLFLVDIAVHARTGFVDTAGVIVMDPWQSAAHYARGGMALDLVCALPWGALWSFLQPFNDLLFELIQPKRQLVTALKVSRCRAVVVVVVVLPHP